MTFSSYEESLLQEFYNNSSIPLWIYDYNKNRLHSFFTNETLKYTDLLQQYIDQIAHLCNSSSYNILYQGSEVFATFPFQRNTSNFLCICGPMLLPGTTLNKLSFLPMEEAPLEWKFLLPVITLDTLTSYLRIFMLLLSKSAPSVDELHDYRPIHLKHSQRSLFIHELFENREYDREHTPYREEVALLNCVRNGDIKKLETTYKAQPKIKYGKMSKNPLRQLFYGSIANVTLITRYAIEGGMEEESAFTLSDVYIQRMERCTKEQELETLNEIMAIEFTNEVAKAKKNIERSLNDPMEKSIHYMNANLHKKITLETLADKVGYSPKYFSRRFLQHTGQTFSNYLMQQRIEEAKELLIYTNYSYTKICHCLCFSSHSYFITSFKQHTGLTPKEYRIKYATISGAQNSFI